MVTWQPTWWLPFEEAAGARASVVTTQEQLSAGVHASDSVYAWCRMLILERCLRRLEFEKAADAEAKRAADQAEAERMAMQSIDW